MANPIDLAISLIAARQFGVFSRAQAIKAGATQRIIDRRLASGRWLKLAPGVYGLPGIPASYVVEDATVKGTLRLVDLGNCFADVVRPAKPGMRSIATVLDRLQGGEPLPASKLERLLFECLDAAGAPPLERQFALPGRQAVKGCVDGADREAMLIVEADGRTWHTRIRDIKRDHERDGEAARVGWQTLRFLHENLTNDPEGEAQRYVDTRETRLRQLSRK